MLLSWILLYVDKKFLSSNAQDFIEDRTEIDQKIQTVEFLSSNAQDFIEECRSFRFGGSCIYS